MCGFAGVIAWDERYRVSRETLEKMSARIAHRGPDGQGIYFSPEAGITPDRPQVALAHRRLAILDPDPRANQPFTDHAGRWLVFNGEIYNFRELRAELSKLQPAYPWRTNGDTEVLLAAYDQWGEKCVEHFNGMFAFAIWDEPKKALFLARDRMGQKPLYYALINDAGRKPDGYNEKIPQAAIAFASEIHALLPLAWIDQTLDERGVASYLVAGYAGSFYCGIDELDPRRYMIADRRQPKSYDQRLYDRHGYSSPGSSMSDQESVATTRHLVHQAVKRQLVSDVPVGCFLSGGIDSSVIASSVRRLGVNIETFSIGFDDAKYDERGFARQVAAHLGTRHHEFVVRPNAIEDLPKLASTFGQPFADSSALPTHYLSRETRGFVKVALSGDGGDELFGGYDRYRAMRLGEKLRQLPHPVLGAMSNATRKLPGTHPKSTFARLKRFAVNLSEPPEIRYLRYISIFEPETVMALIPKRPYDVVGEVLCDATIAVRDWFSGHDVVRGSMRFDQHTYLPFDLLTKVDRASMLHALEVRSPFMDHELVQFAAGLTTDQLLKGGPKRMLREAFAGDLPAWVFKRKKMGFAVPIGDWFRGELRSMLRDHLFAADSFAASHFNRAVVERLVEEHETFRNDHSQRLYALLMLELWWKTV